ncbi:MAG: hypothetical protein U9Q90_05090 [Campylobacterota bacterium]|nr:hypothetical protein [Campylobacterota bacterium]
MHIAFKFHYIHDNGLFIRLLNRIRELSELPLSLHQEGVHYRLEASGDQAALETVAELITSLIPRSLFLRDYSIEEIHREENSAVNESTALPEKNIPFQIPYCPECQNRVIETLNPFEPCHVCGFSESSLSGEELSAFTGFTAERDEMFFVQLADELLETGELTLPTYNGVRHFSLLNSEGNGNKGILICDPADISERFLITQGELDTLMMVEKPTVRLKPKLKFRSEYELDEPFYPVFFADDKVTLALSAVLKDNGVGAVFCDHPPTLCAVASLEQHVIVTVGRDMLPWRYPLVVDRASFCEFNGIQAFGDANGLQLDSRLDSVKEPFIRYAANGDNFSAANTIYFEPAHAALRSIVLEHDLEEKSLCGIYLSHQNQSQICSFAPKIGYTPMVLFPESMLSQPGNMLEAIADMDESGMRLIDNFKKTFPGLCEKIEQIKFSTDTDASMITRLWAMAALFIGLYEGDDLQKACEVLESTAIEFGGKSGPRIDHKVISTEEGYQLDPRLAIRSAISFKLAGVDEYLLSFGFIDSLADFIAEQAENADANIGIAGATLGGSLFENRQLLMRTYNAISANYTIYRNERLGLDDANIAFGAITLGSE